MIGQLDYGSKPNIETLLGLRFCTLVFLDFSYFLRFWGILKYLGPILNPKLILKLVHFLIESSKATNLWII